MRELRLDRLVGREVYASNNQRVGRLEEIRVELRAGRPVVVEYVIGAAGLLERVGLGARLLFGRSRRGRVARWDQLDVDHPEHPRLTCPASELGSA
jgi:hypothetical protein